MLLYADSILIPDPILSWIESPRSEERFRNVRLLEAAFVLLHLKPLVDADLPSSSIVIFPSFERSLEERDPTTQTGIATLATRVISHSLGHQFQSVEEMQKFVTDQEDQFIREVEEQKLFVAPGGYVGQPISEALDKYVEEIKRWRSKACQAMLLELPKGALLLNGLLERLAPHYHLLENAAELSACPLFALEDSGTTTQFYPSFLPLDWGRREHLVQAQLAPWSWSGHRNIGGLAMSPSTILLNCSHAVRTRISSFSERSSL